MRLSGGGTSRLVVASDGLRGLALTHEKGAWRVEQCDLLRGDCQPLWEGLDAPVQPPLADVAEGAFLADGGIVVAARPVGQAAWEVRAFEADGRPRWLHTTPASSDGPTLLGEPRPGVMLIHSPGVATGGSGPHPVLVVDVADGRLLRTERGLMPALFGSSWARPFHRGPAATFFGTRSGVVRLDPDDWRREPVPLD